MKKRALLTARPRPSVASDKVKTKSGHLSAKPLLLPGASLTLRSPSESETKHARCKDERYSTEELD